MKYGRLFLGFLRRKSTFFYGVADENLELDEAAKRSSEGKQKDGMRIVSSVNQIPESSLLTIWKAAQGPKNAEKNAVDSPEYFPPDVVDKLHIRYRELHAYIEHSRKYHTAAEKLSPRSAADYKTGKLPWDNH